MQIDLAKYWYRRSLHPVTLALLPFSLLFGFSAALRRWAYQTGIKKKYRFSVPVIMVGNIAVGGTGKTPFVIWLAQWLQAQGHHPGIVSRGVGGKKQLKPYRVEQHDVAQEVGDEAILLRQRTECPVVVCVDRVAAVRHLLQFSLCDIVISDDGLQHYRLDRDLEVIMVDATRGFGNHWLLPSGPLREPVTRLHSADLVVMNGGTETDEFSMSFKPAQLISMHSTQNKISLSQFPHKKVHAVAGIGHPGRFFNELKQMGFEVIPHVFSDHYLYQQNDFHFKDTLPVIMTEKDAVKCRSFADERFWYLSMDTQINVKLEKALLSWLNTSEIKNEYESDLSKPACHPINPFLSDDVRQPSEPKR